jgi:hypothetical protein
MESLAEAAFTDRMITPGQTIENPVTGERFTFTDTAATSGGELLAFDFALRPGGAVGLRKVEAGPGDVVEVAPGVAHSFANAGDDEARLHVEVRPALAMEDMFAEVVAMAEAGRMNRRGMPRNLLDLADLARRYDQEAHAPLLSVRMQRLLLAPLVFMARHRRAGRSAAVAGSAA